ncbi:MAG: sensor histidine kinase, partial [Roseimicrobium sp.]
MGEQIPLLTCLALLGAAVSACGEPMTSVTFIRRLSPEEGARSLPVQLDAVATFYHDDWGVLFIHDGRDSICVGVPPEQRPAKPFAPGDRLRVDGVTGPGEFLPVVLPARIEVQGRGALPEYQKVSAEGLFLPGLDGHPVEVRAVVKSTSFGDQSLVVDLQIDGTLVKAVLPQRQPLPQLPWELLERRVRVRGIAGTHFNDQRQMSGRLLFVQDLDAFQPDEEAASVGEVPWSRVDSLLRADASLRQRVRVSGVATHVLAGRGLYLRGEGGSMWVQTAQPVSVKVGDEVEAEGYPAVTPFKPSLSATSLKLTGGAAMVEPLPFRPTAPRHGSEQCEFVTVEATLVEVADTRTEVTLHCNADGQVFEAPLTGGLPAGMSLASGMKLRLAGICELLSTRPLVIPRNTTAFRIHLRTANDITILASPPWWDARRARWAVGIVGAVALAAGAWAVTLQSVVRSQSALIRRQTQQQATMEERQRIARDLHDTLEQELVGVGMLLDSTAMKLSGAHPQASEPLRLARRLLRRAREESRSTIRDLRSVTLEQRGLPAAIDELLRPMATVSGAAFEVCVTGRPLRLAGTLETQLLRLAQEAVANAAHHAAAQRIQVALHYQQDVVRLEVR